MLYFNIVYLIIYFPLFQSLLSYLNHTFEAFVFVVFMDFHMGSRRDSSFVLRTRPRWSLTDPREDRVAPRRSSGVLFGQNLEEFKTNSPLFSVCVV